MEGITRQQLQDSMKSFRQEMGVLYPTKDEVGKTYATGEDLDKLRRDFNWLIGILLSIIIGVVSFQTWLIFRLDDRVSRVDAQTVEMSADTAFIKGFLSEWEVLSE